MKTKLILIGGVPGTGKTTIAYKLALLLKIDKVVSTDMLKIYAKTYNQNFDKYVFTTTYEAHNLENTTVIEGYLKYSDALNNLVINILNNIKDKIIIIEGCTINKEFVKKLDKEKYEIIYFNISLDKKYLIERYKLKEKLRKSNWLSNINTIMEIDTYLSNNQFNFLNNNSDYTVNRMVNYVKEILYI